LYPLRHTGSDPIARGRKAFRRRIATPGVRLSAARTPARILKQEEPFRCSKPFGLKSTIERVVTKLEGKHRMYNGSSQRIDIIIMCEDGRVAAVAEQGFDPYGANNQTVRTTDDYLREREAKRRREPDRS
jgi:hypothetical protein